MNNYKRLYAIQYKKASSSPFCKNEAETLNHILNLPEDKLAREDEYNSAEDEIKIAVELDRLSALKKAALENGYDELKKAYDELYAQLFERRDNSTYEEIVKKADELESNHALRHYHFNNIFVSYINSIGDEQYTFVKDSVVASLKALNEEGYDFFKLADLKEYRDALFLNDAQYKEFIEFARNINVIPSDLTEAHNTLFAQTWKIIKDEKDRIKKLAPADTAPEEGCIALCGEEGKSGYEFITLKVDEA